MLTIRALTGGATYASRHLSSNDYYSEHERVVGHWMGQGAERLGLKGEVRMDQFDAIRQGLDPSTGEYLRPRQSADRFNEAGERTATARNLYDFTVSAPKSVSIESIFDLGLVDAHHHAVEEMAREMERLAGARVRQNGADENRTTGNLMMAAYQHDTSRELDPQLHSHLVAANLTWDNAEGRWKALQASAIYEQREYLTEVYRNALAREVLTRGYRIEDRYEQGRERGFEIQGVAPETLEKFSRRSEQRDQAIAIFREQNGRPPTNREIAVLVRESRTDKLAEISTGEVKWQQWSRMDRHERERLQTLADQAHTREPVRERAHAMTSLLYAEEHVFERVSVAKDYELQTEALRHGRGQIDLAELKTAAWREERGGSMLKAGNEVATEESLARERAMVSTIDRGQGRYGRLGGTHAWVVSDRLRPEQKHAVEAVLDSRDLAIYLRGAAGTGKTATLQEIQRGLAAGGRTVVATAPTRAAVEELQNVGFPHALTIDRLLEDPREHIRLTGSVWIVDEAGMVSSRQMAALLHLAEGASAQLLLSGDTQQLQSVEAGDALRVLEQESRLTRVSLRQVQRQTLAAYRSAVEELRQDPARGFARLEQMGAVREVDWQLRPQEVSHAYREALARSNAQGRPCEVLVLAPTHDEIRRVTHAIRSERTRAGELGPSEPLTRHVPLHWTQAQKQQMKHYRPGLVLEFHKATKDVRKQEAVEVLRVEQDQLRARKDSGQEITLTRRQAQAYTVYERQAIEVAAGDKLLLEANRRQTGFRATNGELVTVARVVEGRIELADGRRLPANYRQYDHGYAATVHRSQGKTVDAVIVSGDRMTKELFYVAATRGRESLTVLTSDTEQLRESIGLSGERQSATELARQAEQGRAPHRLPEWDIERGLASARHQALRSSAAAAVAERLRGFEQAPERAQQPRGPHQEKDLQYGYGFGE